MDIAMITELITNIGFPIACVIALAWFAFYIVQKTNESNKANMKQLQEKKNFILRLKKLERLMRKLLRQSRTTQKYWEIFNKI